MRYINEFETTDEYNQAVGEDGSEAKTHKPIKIGEGIMSAINNIPKIY